MVIHPQHPPPLLTQPTCTSLQGGIHATWHVENSSVSGLGPTVSRGTPCKPRVLLRQLLTMHLSWLQRDPLSAVSTTTRASEEKLRARRSSCNLKGISRNQLLSSDPQSRWLPIFACLAPWNEQYDTIRQFGDAGTI